MKKKKKNKKNKNENRMMKRMEQRLEIQRQAANELKDILDDDANRGLQIWTEDWLEIAPQTTETTSYATVAIWMQCCNVMLSYGHQ